MGEITITVPHTPKDPVYVVYNNLIQKGILQSINVDITKPSTSIVETTKGKVTLDIDPSRIIYKNMDEIFASGEEAAQWLENNVQPPEIIMGGQPPV